MSYIRRYVQVRISVIGSRKEMCFFLCHEIIHTYVQYAIHIKLSMDFILFFVQCTFFKSYNCLFYFYNFVLTPCRSMAHENVWCTIGAAQLGDDSSLGLTGVSYGPHHHLGGWAIIGAHFLVLSLLISAGYMGWVGEIGALRVGPEGKLKKNTTCSTQKKINFIFCQIFHKIICKCSRNCFG